MIVLDAAALVDIVLDQALRAWLLDQLVDEAVCAPAHQPAQVLSVIARLRRAGELGDDVARDALGEATALGQELVLPAADELHRAFALQDRVRVLDAMYVVLAEQRGCPLMTADRRLAGAQPPCEVRTPPAGGG